MKTFILYIIALTLILIGAELKEMNRHLAVIASPVPVEVRK